MKVKVYELKLKVFLLKDIEFKKSRESICHLLDKALAQNEEMQKIHNENNFKFYTFNNFYPIEKNKNYKSGNIYSITIRTIDIKLANYFKKYLVNEYTEAIKALTIEMKEIPIKYIDRIYSITPAVAKFENGYWRENVSIDVFERRIKENLIKKYNKFFNTKINEDFELFTFIRFENSKPIPCDYKNITILGDKITLSISDNKQAQELAYVAIGSSLLEMGSRGLGYCNFKWL